MSDDSISIQINPPKGQKLVECSKCESLCLQDIRVFGDVLCIWCSIMYDSVDSTGFNIWKDALKNVMDK